jgi:hypothetical protein
MESNHRKLSFFSLLLLVYVIVACSFKKERKDFLCHPRFSISLVGIYLMSSEKERTRETEDG